MLARFRQPAVVRLPFVVGGIPCQHRFAALVESEPIGKRMRLGLALPNATTAHECIKAHDSPRSHRTPFGYTSILLASPVFRRSMALEKSFIGMRSVITGCRSSLPALSSAVIWYQV